MIGDVYFESERGFTSTLPVFCFSLIAVLFIGSLLVSARMKEKINEYNNGHDV